MDIENCREVVSVLEVLHAFLDRFSKRQTAGEQDGLDRHEVARAHVPQHVLIGRELLRGGGSAIDRSLVPGTVLHAHEAFVRNIAAPETGKSMILEYEDDGIDVDVFKTGSKHQRKVDAGPTLAAHHFGRRA